MKLRYRMKRSTKQYIIVALICIIVIGGAAIATAFVITSQIREEYIAKLQDAYNDLEINKRFVYVTTKEISSGEPLSKDNIAKMTVYSSQPQEYFMTEQAIGKVALINLKADTQVLTGMVTENAVSSELREMEYQVITMNSNIIGNDTVDIRIVYPNGESYVVLAKKGMKGISEDAVTCYLWMKEEEILRMSAAIVDASLYPGSKLVTSRYIEPAIQEESVVTYIPSLSILSLLEKDPNIVERCSQELEREVRKALENRLAGSMTTDVSKISWDVDSNLNLTFPEASTEKKDEEASEDREISNKNGKKESERTTTDQIDESNETSNNNDRTSEFEMKEESNGTTENMSEEKDSVPSADENGSENGELGNASETPDYFLLYE